jgi:type II secretory pathway component PulM
MPAALIILGVVALLALALALVFFWRLRSIAARVGSFQCALHTGSRWVPGIAMYTHDALVWYDVVSLSRSPRHRWDRSDLVILERCVRQDPVHDRVVVEARCLDATEPLQIAAAPAAFEGLVSWLEASPPGARSSGVI